jgi:hypothetical protein
MSLLKDMDKQNARMNLKQAEMIKQLSRLQYGKDKAEVESEIQSRSNL